MIPPRSLNRRNLLKICEDLYPRAPRDTVTFRVLLLSALLAAGSARSISTPSYAPPPYVQPGPALGPARIAPVFDLPMWAHRKAPPDAGGGRRSLAGGNETLGYFNVSIAIFVSNENALSVSSQGHYSCTET